MTVDRHLITVDRHLLTVDRHLQLLSVDRQLLSVYRQLLSGNRQLRKCRSTVTKCRSTVTKCRSTVTKCRSTVTKCRLLVKRVTFHVPNGPPYKNHSFLNRTATIRHLGFAKCIPASLLKTPVNQGIFKRKFDTSINRCLESEIPLQNVKFPEK